MKATLFALVGLCGLGGLGGLAHADESFESRSQNAQHIRDLGDLAWALTATCDAGEDVHQRQCRHVRDARVKEIAGATLLVDAQPGGFEVGAWSAAKKSIQITLYACIDCSGVDVAGKRLIIAGNSAPVTIEGGKVHAARILDTARAFRDEAAAQAWLKLVPGAQIQFLVKVPDRVRWQIAGKEGLGLEVLGYRIYAPCEGTVLLASPESGALAGDKKACAKATR